MKARLLTGALALGSLVVGLAAAEAVCRALEVGSKRIEDPDVADDIAEGWRGVRRFGDVKSPRPRLLILGDSFTAGRGVDEGEDYGSVIGRQGAFEVFSYAGEGYSTAQELLVGRRLLPRIRPNAVLLQMTTNDFVNNSYELESESLINNNLKMRPYFEAGGMVPRYPRFGGGVRAALVGRSAFARRFFQGLDRGRGWLAVEGWLDTVENDIVESSGRHEGFRRSMETTRELLRLLRDEARPAPLYVFPADGVGSQAVFLDAMAEICDSLQIPFFHALPETIDRANASKDPVYLPNDPHWSARGHAIAADAVGRWLATLFPARSAAS